MRMAALSSCAIARNQLAGEMPPELGNLAYLENLRLFDNEISGQIPSQLGNLANLEHLILFGNEITGQIPSELGNLTHLKRLFLWDNQLTGEIPRELGDLANLQRLDLRDNQLTGEVPAELQNLTNLKYIGLGGNQLTGDSFSNPEDKAILVALYQATGGPDWGDNDGWLSDAPLSAWHGVTSDSKGRVIALALFENQLSGEIPPGIRWLGQPGLSRPCAEPIDRGNSGGVGQFAQARKDLPV